MVTQKYLSACHMPSPALSMDTQRGDSLCLKGVHGQITKGDVHTTACPTMREGHVLIRVPTGSAEETLIR